MKFSEPKAFARLSFPVHEQDSKANLLEAFPAFARYKEFVYFQGERNRFIRYICYYYDPNSDLQNIPDNQERKRQAAFLAGFEQDKNDGFLSSPLRDVMEGHFHRDGARQVFEMIFTFLTRLLHAHRWTDYCACMMEYEQVMAQRMQTNTEKDVNKKLAAFEKSAKLIQISDFLFERMERLKKEIFQDNETEFALAEEARYPSVPETIAGQALIPR